MSGANFWVLALAIVLDGAVGDPPALWRRIPHPVAVMGNAIAWLDARLNDAALSATSLRRRGIGAVVLLVAATAIIGIALELALAALPYGWVIRVVLVAVFLAGRSLYDHVAAVAAAFGDGLPAARAAVSRIVGRDPETLDEAGIARAAIESTAENFSDGVVAPALWFALLGLPGLLAYKAINTADSMIGHLNERYRDFGWAAARLDDLVNLPASRIAGSLIVAAAPVNGVSALDAFGTMLRDAPNHRSPNAGWPEAAMAAALGVALAGPRTYGGVTVDDAVMNPEGRRDATRSDVRGALRLYVAANAGLLLLVSLLAYALAP